MDTGSNHSGETDELLPSASIMSLPKEILEKLIFDEKFDLSYTDIENLESCCKFFYYLIKESGFQWKKKFLNRWRRCISPDEVKDVDCWRSLYRLRVHTVQRVHSAIQSVTRVLLHRWATPTCITRLLGADDVEIFETKYLSDCILDELYEICDLRSYNGDLNEFLLEASSRQHYGMELLKILRVKQQLRIWESKIQEKGGVQNISLVEGLVFVENTLVPETDVRHVHVEPYMQTLTVQVLKELERVNLSLYNRYQQQSGASSSDGFRTKLDGAENGTVIECILTVLLQYHEVKGCFLPLQFFTTWKTSYEPDTALASPELLIFLAQCLAERLGAVSELNKCYSPNRSDVLSFLPDLNNRKSRGFFNFKNPTTSSGSLSYFTNESSLYKQIRRLDKPLTSPDVLIQYIELQDHASPRDFHRAIELTVYLKPNKIDWIGQDWTQFLIEHYYKNNINLIRARELEKNVMMCHGLIDDNHAPLDLTMVDELKISKDIPVRDRQNPLYSGVKYAVGMIMHHTLWHRDCVIYGWSPVREASPYLYEPSLSWRHLAEDGVLKHGPNQPFYHVLMHDFHLGYAAQENLIPHRRPLKIRDYRVGRYMKSFEQTHYLMNRALLSYYPGDEEFTINHAHRKYSENRSD